VKVEISRFSASAFELDHRKKNERAFLRREDPEFVEAVQAEAAYESKLKKMPLGLGRLIPVPAIEITDERWHTLRVRIVKSIPIVEPGPCKRF
jgi:hypothetical protein